MVLPCYHLLRKYTKKVDKALTPWYADDTAVVGTASECRNFWNELMWRGPAWGYHPNPEKSICVPVRGHGVDVEEQLGDIGLKFRRGKVYLGGFIGDRKECVAWI